jgi:hypothetical protein|tara:strand:+ start:490 stop:768 length:279 start_codon:yes stop_codon:yes gene_type:complete
MDKEYKLTTEQEKELIKLSAEIEAEAMAMKLDYDENPSHESGSVVYINNQSTLLDDEKEELGHQVLVSSAQMISKEIEKQKKDKDKDKEEEE